MPSWKRPQLGGPRSGSRKNPKRMRRTKMSRVPLVVPLWVLGILLAALAALDKPPVLVVGVGAVLIAWGLLLRLMLRRHDKDHNTN
jgi:protein-S-isoprenylcysteine O-methyltransferase Ste14